MDLTRELRISSEHETDIEQVRATKLTLVAARHEEMLFRVPSAQFTAT